MVPMPTEIARAISKTSLESTFVPSQSKSTTATPIPRAVKSHCQLLFGHHVSGKACSSQTCQDGALGDPAGTSRFDWEASSAITAK